MTISARVIADSTYELGTRLTTFVLRYPRFVHAEFMTHRVFSRNAASSRAIPVAKMIQAIQADPAMPVFWGKNQAGMQAAEELTGPALENSKKAWLLARDLAILQAKEMLDSGLHKQIANRVLEPWMHIEVVVTATDWANFYALRDHKDAQPEIQELARKMLEAHNASTPVTLQPGEWHLPFINTEARIKALSLTQGREPNAVDLLLKVSVARCARVSYLKHDGVDSTYDEDLALFDRLMNGEVKHASPTEHQAKVPERGEYDDFPLESWAKSNLRGWIQHRKLIEGETIKEYKGFK